MKHTEKTLWEETIFTGRIITVKQRQVQLENGRQRSRELVLHPGATAVLPIDDENNVYLIRQFRAPFEQTVLEIPAGKLEKGEDPLAGVKRELSEETGFTAAHYFSLGQMWPSVGFCDEVIHLYMARGLTKGAMHPDEDEFISIEKFPLQTAWDMCMDGSITDGKTLTAILKAARLLKGL